MSSLHAYFYIVPFHFVVYLLGPYGAFVKRAGWMFAIQSNTLLLIN